MTPSPSSTPAPSSTPPTSIAGITLPVDLSPTQRAALKLWSHLLIIAVFNGLLAAMALLGTGVSWPVVLTSATSQAVLALLDALYKYYKASGQVPLSTFFALIRAEAASRVPSVKLDSNEQALQQTVSDLFSTTGNATGGAPVPSYSTVVAAPSPSSPALAEQGTSPQATTPALEHPDMSNVQLTNSIPNLAAIRIPTAPPAPNN